MFPDSVPIDPQTTKRLTALLKRAYVDITAEIEGASSFGVSNRLEILAQVRDILSSLGVEVNDFIRKEIPDAYRSGALNAVEQLGKIGAEVAISTGFSRVHKQMIAALVSDTATNFGISMQTVYRSTNKLMTQAVKDQLTQKIGKAITSGENLRKVKQNLVAALQNQGITGLVDKSGKHWQLDTYTEMLYRTKLVEARNLGFQGRMLDNGYDLVQVSSHGALDVCGEWEGRILSLTGETTEFNGEEVFTVEQARESGLFHPNCKHAINAIAPELAQETQAYTQTRDDKGNPIYAAGGGL